MTTECKYTMAQADYDKIIEAIQPQPLIMLQCGMPKSPQERANDAWQELGNQMGFDAMTVRPGSSRLEFYACRKAEEPRS